jgi:carboxypeptidase Q
MKTDLNHRFNSRLKIAMSFAGIMLSSITFAQTTNKSVIDAMMQEENTNSQVQQLAHELFDGIGPRLVGTPQMKKANDWAVEKYKS